MEPPCARGLVVLREAVEGFPADGPSPEIVAARELLVRHSAADGIQER